MLLHHTLRQAAHGVAHAAGARRTPSSAIRYLADMGRTLLSLVVPPLCLGCETVMGSEERWLCTECRLLLSRSVRPRARTVEIGAPPGKTGVPAGDTGVSASENCALSLRVDYVLDYSSIVSRLITELKYGDKPGLAGVLAPFMNSALTCALPEDTILVPVPIHPSRKRERGYNQSELLAARIAEARGLHIDSGLLLKTRSTGSQTALEREERLENVVGSFGVRSGDRLSGRNVLLVDDVVTTGSTLRECARAVLESGAREVSACVAASSL